MALRKTQQSFLLFSGLSTTVVLAAEPLVCPILTCEDELEPGVCFQHDGSVPTKILQGTMCFDPDLANPEDVPLYCPFEYQSEYQWIQEELQGQRGEALPNESKHTSQIKQKRKQAKCKEVMGRRQIQNPGRNCNSHDQCKSQYCYEMTVCQGLKLDKSCYSHEDCDVNSYCNVNDFWPYESVCTAYRKPYDEDLAKVTDYCDEDFQCPVSHICWFRTPEMRAKNEKVCLAAYSAEEGTDFGWEGDTSLNSYELNGRYCKSGLAYNSGRNTAKCTSTTGIWFNKKKLDEPYACNPTDPNKKCEVRFNIDDADKSYATGEKSYVTADCKCAMTDSTSGYCGSVIGTENYARTVRAKKLVLERSNCHTLDRNDLLAQKDECGIGVKNEEWRFAVDQQFNVTHWPYIQQSKSYHCVQSFFKDSYVNMILEQAEHLTSAMAVSLVLINLL